jgi:hypothetical protein
MFVVCLAIQQSQRPSRRDVLARGELPRAPRQGQD